MSLFVDKNGKRFAARNGQAIFYWGPAPELFRAQFAEVGMVLASYPKTEIPSANHACALAKTVRR